MSVSERILLFTFMMINKKTLLFSFGLKTNLISTIKEQETKTLTCTP